MSRIQNSKETGGWDVWVTPAGGDPDYGNGDEFVGTASNLSEACVLLLDAIAAEEKDALSRAIDQIAKLEEGISPRVFDEALLEVVLRRAKGGGKDD